MNTLIKRQNLLAGLLTFLCVFAAPPALLAQAEAQSLEPVSDLRIVHGLLDGTQQAATLGAVVHDLQGKSKQLNVVVPPDLSDLTIGDLVLHDAPPDLALQALAVASGNQFVVETRASSMGPIPLFIIRKFEASPAPPSDMAVEAVNISGYIHYLTNIGQATKIQEKVDRIFDIIKIAAEQQQAMQQQPGSAAPKLRVPEFQFFPDADLIILVGPMESVWTARKIIDALPGQRPDQNERFGGGGGRGRGASFAPETK